MASGQGGRAAPGYACPAGTSRAPGSGRFAYRTRVGAGAHGPSRAGKVSIMRARTASVLLAALLGGCGGVFSRSPASDEATTRYDERLVGYWRVDEEATPGAKADAPRDESILVAGRRAGSEQALELMIVTLKRDKTLETSRSGLSPTTIGAKEYASVRVPADKEKDKDAAAWTVLRYSMPDADTLRVLGMEEKTAAADVRAGKIPGSVSESKPQPGAESPRYASHPC